jgi:type IV secretion system protein VirB8
VFGFNKKDTSAEDKKNWYTDRYQRVIVERNILALITLLSLVCSIAATFSISQLAPLKSVEPFVIQVDQKSGVTQVVDPLKARELTAKEAVNDYFIVQYVRARESYLGTLERNYFNYNIVRVFSSADIFRQYQADIILTNKDSPAVRLGVGGSREVHIDSIKYLDKRTLTNTGEEARRYLVKMQVTEKGIETPLKVMQKLVLIEFKYAELDLTTEDRYLNPIGFRVLSYSVNDDNLTQ